jgi:hypothetical protein
VSKDVYPDARGCGQYGGEDDEKIADVELLCDVSVGYHADVRVM